MTSKLWKEFIQWGSGFKLEAERLYDEKNEPLFYRLTMYGLAYKFDEIIGEDIEKVLKEAIEKGKKNLRESVNIQTLEDICKKKLRVYKIHKQRKRG